MPKRKRAVSEEPRLPPSVPLTSHNLARLQQALSPEAMPPARTTSPTRTTATTLDDRHKLECYDINVDTATKMPAALMTHIDTVMLRSRSPNDVPSPNARIAVARRPVVAMQNETGGSKEFAHLLLPMGEADESGRAEPVPFVTQKAELLLNRYFLPSAPDPAVTKTWKALSQPKPDSCVGYILQREAKAARVRAPFTAEEEGVLNDYVLTKLMYMPFMTAQWKAPHGNEGLFAAQSQSARDGAVIVNHLYDLYRVAYSKTPGVVETCHFSVTCDIQSVEIWVHWRDGSSHHMELIFEGHCRKEVQMLDMRAIVRNIQQYAINERLRSIRAALPLFARNKKGSKYPVLQEPDFDDDVDDDTASQPTLSNSGFGFPTPRAPSNAVSEPVKKRRRVQSNGQPSDSAYQEGESS
ncbi:hypothetical protein CC86DRAFT_374129 [Ophiobolus disseminans]|uniref:DUF7924 domain-containing protein n=1 Tax=Ophiobolus disseminans TaxID=1469910 RepID=A0A6A6ZIB0_9PLEO|nr:hypothetical protein CC86DRAFT_374129 [Ophiobolus disseminans]